LTSCNTTKVAEKLSTHIDRRCIGVDWSFATIASACMSLSATAVALNCTQCTAYSVMTVDAIPFGHPAAVAAWPDLTSCKQVDCQSHLDVRSIDVGCPIQQAYRTATTAQCCTAAQTTTAIAEYYQSHLDRCSAVVDLPQRYVSAGIGVSTRNTQ
jgi:hypothetical protein